MGGRTTQVNVEELDDAQLRAFVPDLLTQLASQQKQIDELAVSYFSAMSSSVIQCMASSACQPTNGTPSRRALGLRSAGARRTMAQNS